jgi:hypothetical protein
MADETTRFDTSEAPAPSIRVTRPDQLSPLILDLSDPAQRELGDYELLEMIGKGGMGIVYRARQRSLDRIVAVKLLATGSSYSREFIARFQSEAQRAARMQHPNIVTIHEIGANDRFSYFSMQLVEGETLADRLQRERVLSPGEAARVLRVLAEAVEYAHELNVLHLDLKPANVLIDGTGRLYIADFGLARPLDQALASELDEISGTPSYMAPEQIEIRKHRLSRATDIYGLGAMLYEFLTGQPPFRGSSVQDTLRRVLRDAPAPPRSLVPRLSRDLQAICLKCLAKAPAERYGSARELAQDLGRFLDGHPISIRKPSLIERLQRWRRQHAISLGAMAGLFVLLVGGLISFLVLYLLGEMRLERQANVAKLAARAMASHLPTPRARARDFLGDAIQERDQQDEAGLEAMAMAHAALVATRDADLRHDADVALAYVRAAPLLPQALAQRGTPTALLTAALLDRPGEGDEARVRRTLAQIRSAIDASANDPVLLAAAASFCRSFPTIPDCRLQWTQVRLRALEPDNAFVWAVSAAIDAPEPAQRLAREAAYWSGRQVRYRNHEREWFRRQLAELDAVAPAVLAQVDVPGVSARELVTFTATANLDLGYMSQTQATLHGLREWCLPPAPEPLRQQVCAAFEAALAAGGDSYYERTYLQDWRDQRSGTTPDPELERIARWQKLHVGPLMVTQARYEPDRAYLRDLGSVGRQAAREALLLRNGVSLTPPPGWQPPK